MSLIAAQISSVLTRMISSTTSLATRNVSRRRAARRRPSAKGADAVERDDAARPHDSYMLADS
jgi:hypothetical protein